MSKRAGELNLMPEAERYAELERQSRLREQLLFDAQVGTWRYDPDEDVYFFSAELSLGHTQLQKVPRALARQIQHPADQAKDDAIRERITTEGGAAETEMRYRRADGTWTHLHVHYRSGRRLPSGRFEMYGLSQDVSAVAETRDEAKANAHRLRIALEAARAAVFEYDYKANHVWLSPEFKELTGRVSEDVPEDALRNYHPDDRGKVRALGGAKGKAEPIDVRLATLQGERWVRLYYEVECDHSGEPRRGVGLLLDIDDQKRQAIALEEARTAAEAATAAKSTFLASVSHEIRTPMNGIVGVLNLLKAETLSEEGRELLTEAIACSDMLGQLINDVLDFSKMEAGKLDLSPHPSDPAAIVSSVLNLIRPQAEAKGIHLRADLGEDLPWVNVDSVRLRQCLFNIVGNAVKFTSEGGVDVRLSVSNGRIRCEVQDTGIGIPDEAREKLFGRFQQADTGTTRKFGGTGLGLAISRSLVRMMGGELEFDSVEGQGTTFRFDIDAPEAAAPKQDLAADIDVAPLAGLRVLVVDDNRTNRIVAVKTLEAMGADAHAVDGGVVAVETVQSQSFDLVLMDINMPDMDGMEATRCIRGLDGPAAVLPIVAMTADVMAGQLARYLAAGMNGLVPKPFSPAQLLSEVLRLARDEGDDEAVAARA